MSRTVSEIYDSMIADKQSGTALNTLTPNPTTAQDLLNDLTSNSKVALWRLFFWIHAYATWVLENIFDEYKLEVDAKVAAIHPLTARWYQAQCLAFQYGDSLAWISNKYQYATIDTAKQIVKLASVVESGRTVVIKVAKLNGSLVEKLSSAELTAFQSYIEDIKGAGTKTTIISEDADNLKIYMTVVYDPAVINSSGVEISSGNSTVETAITDYLKNLPFVGIMRLSALVDEIQKVSGVIDVELTSHEAKYGLLSYSAFTRQYAPFSGHLIIDPSFPLSSTITFEEG